MEKIKINLRKFRNKDIKIIADYFQKGKVIVYPTDTIYGIGCSAINRKAIERIYKIKKRARGKPMLVLAGSLAMAKKYCYVSKKQEEYLRKIWPIKHQVSIARPVSVVLKSKGLLPNELAGGGKGLAVRLPRSEFLIKIIKGVKVPIVSTSLNLSGRKNLTEIKNLEKYFKSPNPPLIKGAADFPDLVVDAGKLKNKPSMIADIREMDNIRVMRK